MCANMQSHQVSCLISDVSILELQYTLYQPIIVILSIELNYIDKHGINADDALNYIDILYTTKGIMYY